MKLKSLGHTPVRINSLSVSSNGSTWVKLASGGTKSPGSETFSILERIDVGETTQASASTRASILTFSILERIDVGETFEMEYIFALVNDLSVSSNGSTWVKLKGAAFLRRTWPTFQYPRTDRRG